MDEETLMEESTSTADEFEAENREQSDSPGELEALEERLKEFQRELDEREKKVTERELTAEFDSRLKKAITPLSDKARTAALSLMDLSDGEGFENGWKNLTILLNELSSRGRHGYSPRVGSEKSQDSIAEAFKPPEVI